MKNKKNFETAPSPYAKIGFDKITAPFAEKSKGKGKSTVSSEDLRVRGKK